MGNERAMVYKNGQMEHNMKAIGRMIKLMGKGKLYFLMGRAMKGTGRMISFMGLVCIGIIILFIRENERKIKCMVKECKYGRMDVNMKGNMWKGKRKGLEDLYGVMVQFIQVNLKIIIRMDKGSMSGVMGGIMKGSGVSSKYMGKGNIFGRMADNIVEVMRGIKKMGMGVLNGRG